MLERIKEVSEAALIAARHKTGSYSQLGEDVILKYIADQIGLKPGIFIDIGASDGKSMSNSYLFRKLDWRVCAFDGAYENELVRRALFTTENIGYYYPTITYKSIGYILSIDIDGQDYYILNSALHLNGDPPAIICLEVNGCIQQETPQTVPLNDNFKHDGTDYYGANLPAFKQLLTDYTLVFHHHSQNAFFVHKSYNCHEFTEPLIPMQYHPHDMAERPWVTL